jgi:hypothetical protein
MVKRWYGMNREIRVVTLVILFLAIFIPTAIAFAPDYHTINNSTPFCGGLKTIPLQPGQKIVHMYEKISLKSIRQINFDHFTVYYEGEKRDVYFFGQKVIHLKKIYKVDS